MFGSMPPDFEGALFVFAGALFVVGWLWLCCGWGEGLEV